MKSGLRWNRSAISACVLPSSRQRRIRRSIGRSVAPVGVGAARPGSSLRTRTRSMNSGERRNRSAISGVPTPSSVRRRTRRSSGRSTSWVTRAVRGSRATRGSRPRRAWQAGGAGTTGSLRRPVRRGPTRLKQSDMFLEHVHDPGADERRTAADAGKVRCVRAREPPERVVACPAVPGRPRGGSDHSGRTAGMTPTPSLPSVACRSVARSLARV